MLLHRNRSSLLGLCLFCVALAACTLLVIPPREQAKSTSPAEEILSPSPTYTQEVEHVLTICLPSEPASLFIYADTSRAAEIVWQALYEPPVELVDFTPQAVLLKRLPAKDNNDLLFEPVEVQKGNLIVNSDGILVNLSEGVRVLPFGCQNIACALSYNESMGRIQMSQMVVRFTLRDDLLWSDGTSMTADDSVYSYEVASAYYPMIPQPQSVAYTFSYRSLDEQTVEWRGVPGYATAYPVNFFFLPLPRRAWANISPQELWNAIPANRQPLGWGAYFLEEWTSGDHLSLKVNPNYFGAAADGPYFDRLTFRIITQPAQALEALRIGECDVLDATYNLKDQASELEALQAEGKVKFISRVSHGWMGLAFGISSSSSGRTSFFKQKEMRQAVALCLDKTSLLEEVFHGGVELAESYLLPGHPLLTQEFVHYAFNPQAASDLFTQTGWIDTDGIPSTPRIAQGVEGVADGTELSVELLTSDEVAQATLAEGIAAALSQCGMQVTVNRMPAEALYEASEGGRLFGRRFDLALLGYEVGELPACAWFTTVQIPGPLDEFPMGWAGVNVSGYSRMEFDAACLEGNIFPYLSPEWIRAQREAHTLFLDDLPMLPLYWQKQTWVARADLCIPQSSSTSDFYWNLEAWTERAECK